MGGSHSWFRRWTNYANRRRLQEIFPGCKHQVEDYRSLTMTPWALCHGDSLRLYAGDKTGLGKSSRRGTPDFWMTAELRLLEKVGASLGASVFKSNVHVERFLHNPAQRCIGISLDSDEGLNDQGREWFSTLPLRWTQTNPDLNLWHSFNFYSPYHNLATSSMNVQ